MTTYAKSSTFLNATTSRSTATNAVRSFGVKSAFRLMRPHSTLACPPEPETISTRAMAKKPSVQRKLNDAVGLDAVDRLERVAAPQLQDYISGVSAYVRGHADLDAGTKKAAQIRLSGALGRVLLTDLSRSVPTLAERGRAGERKVAGALRTVNADVSETHELDGLRLAVEIKPVNLAVGRAIWSRFGDVRTFAVNIHLKFPFAVVGGVLVVPTYEITSTGRRSTVGLIQRAVDRLQRAGGRVTEADAPHLLEAIAVVVYDPDTAMLETAVPPAGSGLRWDEFVDTLSATYLARFEG